MSIRPSFRAPTGLIPPSWRAPASLIPQFNTLTRSLLCSQTEPWCDRIGTSVPVSSSGVLQEASHPAGGSTDVPNISVSTKLSGQHSYLQSLDRSSRAWVLSSGKSLCSDAACGPQQHSYSNIWYNPIPEEEDVAPAVDKVWTRRDQKEEEGEPSKSGLRDTRKDLVQLQVGSSGFSGDCQLDGTTPSVRHHPDDITAENTGEISGCTC